MFTKNLMLATAIEVRTSANLRMLRMYVDNDSITRARQDIATVNKLRDDNEYELTAVDYAKAFGLDMPIVHNIVIAIPESKKDDDTEDKSDAAEKENQGGRRNRRQDTPEKKADEPKKIPVPFAADIAGKSRMMQLILMAYQAKHHYTMSDHVKGKIVDAIAYGITTSTNYAMLRNIAEILAKQAILG